MKAIYVSAAFFAVSVCGVCFSQTPQILRATYGADSNQMDVTAKLQSLVQSPQPDMRVGSQLFESDPASGKSKTLSVVFSFNGLQYQIELRDGEPLSFANANRTDATVTATEERDTTSRELHIEALKVEIKRLQYEQKVLERQFSIAVNQYDSRGFSYRDMNAESIMQVQRKQMEELIEAKQNELNGLLLEQQKEAAATPR